MKLLLIFLIIFEFNSVYAGKTECSSGFECFRLGIALVQKSNPDFVKHFQKACNLDHRVSCYIYGSAMLSLSNSKTAIEYYQKGCNLNDAKSCYGVGKVKNNELSKAVQTEWTR